MEHTCDIVQYEESSSVHCFTRRVRYKANVRRGDCVCIESWVKRKPMNRRITVLIRYQILPLYYCHVSIRTCMTRWYQYNTSMFY